MALREKFGGDPNLFKVDRLQRRLRQKQGSVKKPVTNVVSKKSGDVFAFLNESLSGKYSV